MNYFQCSSTLYHKDLASSRGIFILASSSSSPRHCSHQKSAQITVVSSEKQGAKSCTGLEVWTCEKYNNFILHWLEEKILHDENSQERFVDWTKIHVEWGYLYVLEPTLQKSRSFQDPHLFALRSFLRAPGNVSSFSVTWLTLHLSYYPSGRRSDRPPAQEACCRTMAFLLGFWFDFLQNLCIERKSTLGDTVLESQRATWRKNVHVSLTPWWIHIPVPHWDHLPPHSRSEQNQPMEQLTSSLNLKQVAKGTTNRCSQTSELSGFAVPMEFLYPAFLFVIQKYS